MKSETEKTRNKYNRISKVYDFMEIPMEWRLGHKRAELLSPLEGKILEVGVGTGKNLQYYNTKAKVTGIDLSPKMLSHAIKRLNSLNKDYSLLLMDAENLKFEDSSFDYVVCTYVLCSVPNPVKALKEMKRVLKPNGKILMLEHMLSDNKLIAAFENTFNPITKGLFGFNINRDTIRNIYRAELNIIEKENIGMHDIFKRIIAE